MSRRARRAAQRLFSRCQRQSRSLLGALLLLLLVTVSAQGQQYQRPLNLDFDLLIQELFAQQGGDDATASYEDLYENLAQHFQSPLNLNTATPEELGSLFILTPNQIANLQRHIRQHGGLLSLYELQAVQGFDLPTIYKLVPFATVPETGLQTDRRKFFNRLGDGDNTQLFLRLTRTLEERKGYSAPTVSQGKAATRYAGSPEQLYARFRSTHFHDYSFGVTAEKDAGEQLRWNPADRQYGPDFLSAHAVLYNRGRLKTIAVGDYQVQFGQGLLLSAGFAVGKGAETVATARRPNSGIRPYTSVLETIYLRGAAATVRVGRGVEVSAFGSRKRVDGSGAVVDTLDTDQLALETFSALSLTGFHRTPNELARRRNVTETLGGGDVTWTSPSRTLQVGVTGVATNYSAPIQRRAVPYYRYAFQGTDNNGVGAHYSWTVGSATVFGESARSRSGGWGHVHGVVASLSATVDAALMVRDYARDFQSFYANGFGEATLPTNERGVYLGVKIRPAARWELSAYYDRFRFPWLRYRVDMPNSGGDEWLGRVLYRPDKLTTIYAQLRVERKDRNLPAGASGVHEVGVGTRRNAVVYAGFRPSPKLELRSRVQASSYQLGTGQRTSGFAIAQDLNFTLARRVALDTRFALFDTDDFDNRQYVYESDVLYAFSIPALNGRGSRAYAVLRYSLTRHLDIWLRAARTLQRDQTTVGSGLEEISGPRRTDFRVQVRWRAG